MEILVGQIKDNGSAIPEFKHIDLVETAFEEAARQIDEFCGSNFSESEISDISEESQWPAWYPLIDYSRCTACGQCSDFCLFGVFKMEDGIVKVINPDGCKNECPACARICPSVAIIFPKYIHGGAIGGSAEIDDKTEQQRQTRDIEEFLGDDIYKSLQRRKLKRQSIIRDEVMKKALSERGKAMDETSSN
jgi:NAD-dependent dihydropyrimidine dehydrogenase PreA subunit